MVQGTSDKIHYPALDGLRGFAILFVLFYHNFNFIPFSEYGWIGVDLFFVLSGFLITEILLKTRGQKKFLRNFYTRRILRIFPLYYLVLSLFFILAPYFSSLQEQYNYYHSNQAMMWAYLQNWFFIFYPTPAISMPFQHFWSLSIEEHYYLLWPFVILVCKNLQKLKWILYIMLACYILFRFFVWLYYGINDFSFNLQHLTRMDGLCIGSLIAVWKFNGEKLGNRIFRLSIILISIHLLVILLAKMLFKNLPHFNILGFTSISALFGIVIIYAIENKNAGIKILLENRFVRYIGKISYGLYIFHYTVLVLFRIYLTDSAITIGPIQLSRIIVIGIGSIVVTVIVSILSYHFFERKFLVLKDRITYRSPRLSQ